MTITTADVTRINFHHKGKESFTVELNQVESSITLRVNNEVRNKIELKNASSTFDEVLEIVKNEFLKLRQTKQ
tara:strand:+ start:906 stop:1124 length:219 start_codon:yes stop_codon:yes gene_type:complete